MLDSKTSSRILQGAHAQLQEEMGVQGSSKKKRCESGRTECDFAAYELMSCVGLFVVCFVGSAIVLMHVCGFLVLVFVDSFQLLFSQTRRLASYPAVPVVIARSHTLFFHSFILIPSPFTLFPHLLLPLAPSAVCYPCLSLSLSFSLPALNGRTLQ